jgi:parallel beta-helix repeat protein
MYNDHSNPTLLNTTLSRNSATSDGGGAYNLNSNPTLTNTSLSGNSAAWGGGMYNSDSNPTLTNTTLSGNSATSNGGGAYNLNSNPTLTNTTLSGNSATSNGGGMYNYNSNPRLTNTTLSGNSVTNNGGGMYNFNSTLTLTNTTLSGNSSVSGGGLYNYISNLTLTNTALSGNSATNNGGGIYNSSSNPTLTNTTLSGNSATNNGGGMYNSNSNPVIQNSIIWGNSGGSISNGSGGSSTITYSIIQGGTLGTGNLNTDPLFKNAAQPAGVDGIWRTADDGLGLQSTSPAINAGSLSITTPTTDITGYTRKNVFDMGAYEERTTALPVELLDFNGQQTENGTQLTWQTASETRFSHFDVERSWDGTVFEKIGVLKAQGSNSNYTFMDPNPFNVTYYRLKINDLDSKFEFSKIISIEMQSSGGVRVKPTFVNDVLTVEGATSYEIVDGAGRVLLQSFENQLNVQSLPQGFYVVRGRDVGGHPFIQKIIKN